LLWGQILFVLANNWNSGKSKWVLKLSHFVVGSFNGNSALPRRGSRCSIGKRRHARDDRLIRLHATDAAAWHLCENTDKDDTCAVEISPAWF
jgi:hypothetical protein